MLIQNPPFQVRLARDDADLRAAQRLRYRVFVQELGGDGPLVDHDQELERDAFDAVFDHLLLIDPLRPAEDQVVGVYRVLQAAGALAAGQFYSEAEYDLSLLHRSGRKLLELGRSCLDPDYRGGTAMYHLWQGLAAYIADHQIEILFGVASFHGVDPRAYCQPLSYLHARHLAPPALRVWSRNPVPMNVLPAGQIDRKQAMLETPALIKAYLRLGGMVGDGAFVDAAFNTVDVCLVLDTARMNDKQKQLYTKSGRHL